MGERRAGDSGRNTGNVDIVFKGEGDAEEGREGFQIGIFGHKSFGSMDGEGLWDEVEEYGGHGEVVVVYSFIDISYHSHRGESSIV